MFVTFTNTSSGASFYEWDFNDGTIETDKDPTHTFLKEGIYNVLIKASIESSNSVCWDTTSQGIAVYELKIPNVFTPNGDTKNDVFFVRSVGIASIDGEIYDRWGIRIFTWNSQHEGWTGKSQVTDMDYSPGTYYYIIKTVNLLGKLEVRRGFILLTR